MEETKIKPTVGRIILFKLSETRTFPAIITFVDEIAEKIELQIFGTVHDPIRYGVSEGEQIGEWSWMPFQKDQQKRAELMAEKIAEEKVAESDVEVSDEEVAADEAQEEIASEEVASEPANAADGEGQPDPSADIAAPTQEESVA